jgi:hypothetical protein
MSTMALCADRDVTMELRDGKAYVTLLRRSILVKDETSARHDFAPPAL